jgi:MarR family transcriptional regulator, organic hydroperoxide resistance regulator
MTNQNELLKLENQLCFSIYACSREMTKMYRPILDKLSLTYPQYLVLLVLWEKKSVSVKELGQELFLDSGTLTPLLKRLEEVSLVNRIRSKEDERRVEITLTEKGLALKAEAIQVPHYMLENSGLAREEFESLNHEFKKLLGRLSQLNQKNSTRG